MSSIDELTEKLRSMEQRLQEQEDALYGNERKRMNGIVEDVREIRKMCENISGDVSKAKWYGGGLIFGLTLTSIGQLIISVLGVGSTP